MPKADCVKYIGKTYCYDKATQMVTEYAERVIPLHECPEPVLKALLNLAIVPDGTEGGE